MRIKLIQKEFSNGRSCNLRYETNIPSATDYDIAYDLVCGFTEHIMKGVVAFSGRFPLIRKLIMNEETGFVEFEVERKYPNSEYVTRAFTRFFNNKCFVYYYCRQGEEESERMTLLSEEEFAHLSKYTTSEISKGE